MAGLSHYRNSKAAMEKQEPVFLNQFEVTLTPPAGVEGGELLLQQVKKLTGLELDKNPGTVEQFYKFAKRRYAGALPETTTMDITIDFEVNLNDDNSMYTFKTLRQWSDLVYNPLTGAMGLKNDYAGEMLIAIHNKAGDIFRKVRCPVCWPISPLPAMELDNLSTELYIISVTFAIDFWEDLFL
jgi:hypothetical protein